jgi:hypothetical protein
VSTTPVGSGLAAARASGVSGVLLAALCVLVGPVLGRVLPEDAAVAAYPIQAMLGVFALIALVRVLAAARPEPPTGADAVSPEDLGILTALRRAAMLRYGLLRYALLDVVVVLCATVLVLPLAGDLLDRAEELSTREQFELTVPITLVAALLQAFVAVVPQRMALRRDPRVMIAVVHSVRVARWQFGVLFGLTLLQLVPLMSVSALYAYDLSVVAQAAVLVLAVPVQLLCAAWLNEAYLRGPALELPPELEQPTPPGP